MFRFRNNFDIATLPGYDLTGQIKANARALLLVYFLRPVKASEDGSLIALGYALDAAQLGGKQGQALSQDLHQNK